MDSQMDDPASCIWFLASSSTGALSGISIEAIEEKCDRLVGGETSVARQIYEI